MRKNGNLTPENVHSKIEATRDLDYIEPIHYCYPLGEAWVDGPSLEGGKSMTEFDATKFSKPLAELFPSGKFVLKKVVKKFEYKDGEKTGKVQGYDYTVVDIGTYDVLTVRVPSLTPLIDPADLEKSGKFPLVRFSEDAVAKPVNAQYGRVNATITASSISFEKQQ